MTSDGGLLLVRVLEECLGLSILIGRHIGDERRGKNTQFPLPDFFRKWAGTRQFRALLARLADWRGASG